MAEAKICDKCADVKAPAAMFKVPLPHVETPTFQEYDLCGRCLELLLVKLKAFWDMSIVPASQGDPND